MVCFALAFFVGFVTGERSARDDAAKLSLNTLRKFDELKDTWDEMCSHGIAFNVSFGDNDREAMAFMCGGEDCCCNADHDCEDSEA